MIFSSFLFLFAFLPLVLVINSLLKGKASNVFLLAVSLLFYSFAEGKLTILLVASIIWNFCFGVALRQFEEKGDSARKWIVGLCVAGNLGLLIYYKYAGFLVESLGLGGWIIESSYSEIILPVGISFFTFQGISYIIDLYRKEIDTKHDLIDMGLYIALFPQLVAGPIVKYNEIAQYLSKRTITQDKLIKGSFKFIRGLVKKLILANTLALMADQVFEMGTESLPTSIAWLGLLAYSLQIYYDFSGYSDMAIGLCLMMGFEIPENFNYPYIARSVKEFWRRWHISLSTWFRDYLYIPLGGNRRGAGRTYLHLIIVFLLTGLWHGASYNFVVWGMIHGAFLIMERMFPGVFARMPRALAHVYTLLVVLLAWVFFRLDSFSEATQYLAKLFTFSNLGDYYAIMQLSPFNVFLLVLAVILCTPIRKWIGTRWMPVLVGNKNLRLSLSAGMYLLVFAFCISELAVGTHIPFIYFKF